jgi:hypothetical protein
VDADESANEAFDLGEPWSSPEDEYEVLTTLVVPAAQANFDRALQDWSALDTKALGVLALVAAIIAGLVGFHDGLNDLWWIPTLGFLLTGILLIASIWPRTADLGPDLIDFHDEMRESTPLEAARAMTSHLYIAAANANDSMIAKGALFWLSLGSLLMSTVGCLPVILLRP